MKSKQKLIIWDFDGVIADTEKLWLQTRMDLINEKFGLNWDFKTTTSFLAGMSDKTRREILDKIGISTSDEFWIEAMSRDMKKILKGFALTDGIEEIFKLKQFEECIATGGTAAKTTQKIHCLGIEKYFPAAKVFTADMVEYGKPEPDLYQLAAEVMGYEPQECIVIEDSIAGMTAGKKAKMQVVAFLGCNLYNNDYICEEIKKLGISDIFYNMADVKKYLLSL